MALFGPDWLADLVVEDAREQFNRDHFGSLEIDEFEFAWNGTQYLRDARLHDPEGRVVLRGDLEFPGFFDIVNGLSEDGSVLAIGRIDCELRGEINVDDDGRSNLSRALERRRPRRERSGANRDVRFTTNGEEQSLADALERLEFVLNVSAPSLKYSDPKTREQDLDIGIRNLDAQLRARPGGSWTLTADADVDGEQEGRLDVSLTAREPDWHDEEWPLGELVGNVDLSSFSTRILDGLLETDQRLLQGMGPQLDLEFQVDDVTAEAGQLEFGMESSLQMLSFRGRFEEGRFLMQGADRLAWTIAAPRSDSELWFASFLPEDFPLAPIVTEGAERWAFELQELSLPVVQGPVAGAPPEGERVMRMLAGAEFVGSLTVGSWNYAKADAAPIALHDLRCEFTQTESETSAALSFDMRANEGAEPAPVSIQVRPRSPWEALHEDTPIAWEADFEATGLAPQPMLDALDAASPKIAAIREPLRIEVHVRDGIGKSARIGARVESAQLLLEITDLTTGGAYLARSGSTDVWSFEPRGNLLGELTRDLAPAGLEFTFPAETDRIVISRISLPRMGEEGYEPDLAGLELDLSVGLDRFILSKSTGEQLPLGPLRIDLKVAPEAALDFHATGKMAGAPSSSLSVTAKSADDWEQIARSGDFASAALALDIIATELPSQTLDDFAGQDGLMVDVLGPTLNLTASSPAFDANGGALVCQLNSRLGTLDYNGEWRDGVLTAATDQGLEARVGLTPLFNERIVGSLVPMIVQPRKAEGAEPVMLTLADCSLPLDGDLSGLNGALMLDLGAVEYRLLPQFEEFLGDKTRLRSSTFAPIEVQIESGVARYENMAIQIGDKSYSFVGSIALANKAMDFATEIPVSNLGTSVDKNLQRLVDSGLVRSDLTIPITLKGTLNRPKVRFREGFLEQLIKDAAPDAVDDLLKRGLDKLFGND